MRNKQHTLATLLASSMARARGQNAASDCHRIDSANTAAQSGFHFETPLTVSDQAYRPQGYGTIYCVHNKTYFEPCPRCKRGKREADLHLQKFLSKLA